MQDAFCTLSVHSSEAGNRLTALEAHWCRYYFVIKSIKIVEQYHGLRIRQGRDTCLFNASGKKGLFKSVHFFDRLSKFLSFFFISTELHIL